MQVIICRTYQRIKNARGKKKETKKGVSLCVRSPRPEHQSLKTWTGYLSKRKEGLGAGVARVAIPASSNICF